MFRGLLFRTPRCLNVSGKVERFSSKSARSLFHNFFFLSYRPKMNVDEQFVEIRT